MQSIAEHAKLHLKLNLRTILRKAFREKLQGLSFFARISYRYKMLLKIFEQSQHTANFFKGNACWGNKQEEELYSWVKKQKEAGFKVMYKNRDKTKGTL